MVLSLCGVFVDVIVVEIVCVFGFLVVLENFVYEVIVVEGLWMLVVEVLCSVCVLGVDGEWVLV